MEQFRLMALLKDLLDEKNYSRMTNANLLFDIGCLFIELWDVGIHTKEVTKLLNNYDRFHNGILGNSNMLEDLLFSIPLLQKDFDSKFYSAIADRIHNKYKISLNVHILRTYRSEEDITVFTKPVIKMIFLEGQEEYTIPPNELLKTTMPHYRLFLENHPCVVCKSRKNVKATRLMINGQLTMSTSIPLCWDHVMDYHAKKLIFNTEDKALMSLHFLSKYFVRIRLGRMTIRGKKVNYIEKLKK